MLMPHDVALARAGAGPLRRALSAMLLAAALLGACAQAPRPAPGPEPVMPASLRQTVTDPARTAIGFTDAVFGRPASVAGRPAVVADAVAELEWLAVAIATDQRFDTALPQFGLDEYEALAQFIVRHSGLG